MSTRKHLHIPTKLGDKIADGVTTFFGTWLCLGLHTVWFVVWFVFGLDVALLTNIVSLEAIGLAILIMMSQSRASARDRARDDLEAQEVQDMQSVVGIVQKQQEQLLSINSRQLDILEILHEMQQKPAPRRAASK